MFKIQRYNYDYDTGASWVEVIKEVDNVNGMQFASEKDVDSLSSDIDAAIYSQAYTVVGILDNWDSKIYFVTMDNPSQAQGYKSLRSEGWSKPYVK